MKFANNFSLLFFLISFSSTLVYSQSNNKIFVTASDEYQTKYNRNVFIVSMLSLNNDIFIIKKFPGSFLVSEKMMILKFDSNLTKKFEKELVFVNSNKKELNFEYALMIKDKPVVFTSYYDDSKDVKLLYYGTINDEGIIENNKEIGRIKTNKSKNGEFKYIFNSDSTKILITERSLQYSSKPAAFSFTVYDSSFKAIWKSSAKLKSVEDDTEFNDFHVDDNGRVFVLVTVKNDGNTKNKYNQEIFLYENGNPTFKNFKVNIKDKIIKNISILRSSNDNLTCFGIYSSSERYGLFNLEHKTILGTLSFNLNIREGNIKSNFVNQFTKKTFDFYDIKDSQIEDGTGIRFLTLNKILKIDSFKNVRVDLKINYEVISTDTKGNSYSTYYSDSPIYIELDSLGDVKNEVIVPLKIRTRIDFGNQHLIAFTNNKTLYIYNGDEENLTKKIGKQSDVEYTSVFSIVAKSKLVFCLIEDGKKAIGSLLNNSKEHYYLNTNAYLQTNSNTLFFVVNNKYKSDGYKLLKVVLN